MSWSLHPYSAGSRYHWPCLLQANSAPPMPFWHVILILEPSLVPLTVTTASVGSSGVSQVAVCTHNKHFVLKVTYHYFLYSYCLVYQHHAKLVDSSITQGTHQENSWLLGQVSTFHFPGIVVHTKPLSPPEYCCRVQKSQWQEEWDDHNWLIDQKKSVDSPCKDGTTMTVWV